MPPRRHGAAAGLVVGRALIADTCDKRTSVNAYAVIYPLVSLSPALAPAIGGHLAAAFGWRTDFMFVAAFGVVALLMVMMTLPKTLPITARSRTSTFAGFSHILHVRTFRRYTLVVCTIYCAWFVYLTHRERRMPGCCALSLLVYPFFGTNNALQALKGLARALRKLYSTAVATEQRLTAG